MLIKIMKRKSRGKAIREPITGKIIGYPKSKTQGIRNPLTGKIEKRISMKEAKKRGITRLGY